MSDVPVNSIGASPPVDSSGSSQAVKFFTPKLKIVNTKKETRLAKRKEPEK